MVAQRAITGTSRCGRARPVEICTESRETSVIGSCLSIQIPAQHELLRPTKIRKWTIGPNPTWRGNWLMRSALCSPNATATSFTSPSVQASHTPRSTQCCKPWRKQSSPIPPELITKLTHWLDAYAHSDDAPRLHELLHAIKSLR